MNTEIQVYDAKKDCWSTIRKYKRGLTKPFLDADIYTNAHPELRLRVIHVILEVG